VEDDREMDARNTNGTAHLDPNRRHDAVLLFDVTDGNPNGDPDAGNLPRVDPETMQGLVTDVAIKRKMRDWVDATRGELPRFKIYVQSQDALNTLHTRAYTALNITPKGNKQTRDEVDQARTWMCDNFFDVRTFGAVMSTGVNAGQVRGPVQLTFSRSIDPIVPLDVSITRIAITREEDARTVTSEGVEEGGKRTEMGRKALVPYGLYRGHVFVNPRFASGPGGTGFDGDDLAVVWEALTRMWDLDRSASRGMMACRGLYVFSHEHPLGNSPAHALFDRVTVQRRAGVVAPRSFGDYDVAVNTSAMPDGVVVTPLVS
jgi:CRISPR-associated protein Csd2